MKDSMMCCPSGQSYPVMFLFIYSWLVVQWERW